MGKRYRWDVETKKLIRVDAEWTPTSRQVTRADVTYMDGVKTIDGFDISSKRKRREYMKAFDVVDATDFSPSYLEGVKKEREREEHKDRREVVGRAVYETLDRRK